MLNHFQIWTSESGHCTQDGFRLTLGSFESVLGGEIMHKNVHRTNGKLNYVHLQYAQNSYEE